MSPQTSPRGLKSIVEGALFAAGGPLTLDQLQSLFLEDERPERADLLVAIAELTTDYAGRGIEIAQVAGGYRVQVRAIVAPWVARLWDEKPARYSRALLETLALIAYRQPITRGEIEDIRGVAVTTQIVKTLSEREWIRVVGHRDVPGRPALYATTRKFLDYFGLRSLNDLPPLSEIRDPGFLGDELDLGELDSGSPPTGPRAAPAAPNPDWLD
jgi:segregation and condensation protein B